MKQILMKNIAHQQSDRVVQYTDHFETFGCHKSDAFILRCFTHIHEDAAIYLSFVPIQSLHSIKIWHFKWSSQKIEFSVVTEVFLQIKILLKNINYMISQHTTAQLLLVLSFCCHATDSLHVCLCIEAR